MITATLSKDEKLTDEDRKMLEEAKKHPITFGKHTLGCFSSILNLPALAGSG